MRKFAIVLAVTSMFAFAATANAAVTTSNNGFATTVVNCHAYQNYISTYTEITDETGSIVQPVKWETEVQRWNGHAWYTYRSFVGSLPDGGYAYYPYVFHVAGGYTYRVVATYGWSEDYPNPTLYGSEIIPAYWQFGNGVRNRNLHYRRYHNCRI